MLTLVQGLPKSCKPSLSYPCSGEATPVKVVQRYLLDQKPSERKKVCSRGERHAQKSRHAFQDVRAVAPFEGMPTPRSLTWWFCLYARLREYVADFRLLGKVNDDAKARHSVT
jgi:hypothetical protein